MQQIYMTSGTKLIDYSDAFRQKKRIQHILITRPLQQIQLIKRIITQMKRKLSVFAEKYHPELQFDA